MPPPLSLTARQAGRAFRRRELGVRDLLDWILDRIAADAAHALPINAWAAGTDRDQLYARAASVQEAFDRGADLPVLAGIPFAVKDIADTSDLPTEAGSVRWRGRQPAEDAACVRRARATEGLLLGKSRTHEFAGGVTTPPTANPWDRRRTPGGSSGGSAAAVAAGQCLWAIGTDTLGSVRMPASLCGVVGLKPTRGLVDTGGVAVLSWTLDHVGVLARDCADAAAAIDAIAAEGSPLDHSDHSNGGPFVVGVPADFTNVESGVLDVLEAALRRLASRGVEIRTIELRPPVEYVRIGFGILAPEAAAWHAPIRSVPVEPQDDYGADVLALLEYGSTVTAVDYIESLRARDVVRDEITTLLREVDAIVTPTTPYVAPVRGEDAYLWPDGTSERLAAGMCRFTALSNVTGLPAVSVPAGRSDSLPVGVQFLGRPFEEHRLLALAALVEAPELPG